MWPWISLEQHGYISHVHSNCTNFIDCWILFCFFKVYILQNIINCLINNLHLDCCHTVFLIMDEKENNIKISEAVQAFITATKREKIYRNSLMFQTGIHFCVFFVLFFFIFIIIIIFYLELLYFLLLYHHYFHLSLSLSLP